MAVSKRWQRWTCSRILEFPRRIERRRWTVKSDRTVVPRAMTAKILDEIHCAHMGESTSLSFARDYVYVFWPAMTPQVKDRVRSCGICSAFRNQQAKRNSQTTSSTWTSMGNCRYWSLWVKRTTLCSSDWLLFQIFWTWSLRQNTATCLINNMKKIFARYGIPQGVVRDNGSQYANKRNLFDSTHQFKEFARVPSTAADEP